MNSIKPKNLGHFAHVQTLALFFWGGGGGGGGGEWPGDKGNKHTYIHACIHTHITIS